MVYVTFSRYLETATKLIDFLILKADIQHRLLQRSKKSRKRSAKKPESANQRRSNNKRQRRRRNKRTPNRLSLEDLLSTLENVFPFSNWVFKLGLGREKASCSYPLIVP